MEVNFLIDNPKLFWSELNDTIDFRMIIKIIKNDSLIHNIILQFIRFIENFDKIFLHRFTIFNFYFQLLNLYFQLFHIL